MGILDIINKRSYYFSDVESLCIKVSATDDLNAQKKLLKEHLKSSAHTMHDDTEEYDTLETLLKLETPDADLQLSHLSDPLETERIIQSSFFSLLDIKPCAESDDAILSQLKSETLEAKLKNAEMTPGERTSEAFQHLPEVILDLLNPEKTDLLEILECHFNDFNIDLLIRDCDLTSSTKTALITQCLNLTSHSIEERYQLLLNALPKQVIPLFRGGKIYFKTHLFLQSFKNNLDIPKLARTLSVSTSHASHLDIIRLKLDVKPFYEAQKILLDHFIPDQHLTPEHLDQLKALHTALYDTSALWSKYSDHSDIDLSSVVTAIKQKHEEFNGSNFSSIPFIDLQNQLARHIEDVLPSSTTTLQMLSQLPSSLFDHKKLVIASIANHLQTHEDTSACKHMLVSYLKSPLDHDFIEGILPKPNALSKEDYLSQFKAPIKAMHPDMTDEQIAEKFVPYLPHEIKSELANHFLSQADTVAAIEALNFRQLIDDPDTFLETLNLAKLNKTLFLKTYFKLHDQYQKPLEFLKDSSKDLLIGQPQMGPFCSTTFKELTQIPSTKEYFENIESLLETIESSYSESDATLIFHRLLSSAHIRSTSGFKFDWGFLDFRYLFKHQPWLYKTPDDILTVMNLMHADFSFIESHNAAQGCRFFVPDIAENEVRRHQIRTLLQFQIQYSIFKRICDQSLKTSDDKAVMQFFSIACSKPVANRFHKAYKQHTMRLLFSEGPEKIKAYAQKAFPQWIDQLQCLINSNPDMSKKELMTILNSILLTPHFIFEKAIHDLRSESPDLVVNEQFLTLCANLNHTINNFDDSKFNAFQGNIHEQHLAMISLYLQYTQNISYTEAQKKALSLPRAISQVILSHCNFAFRSFLYQCIEAIESSKTKILNIKFDMDLPEEMTIDLNPLLITGSARHHESSLIKLIEHIDQSVIEHSSQQTNAIRDAVVQTEYYSNWKGPLRQAQISFENGNEPLPGFFTVIKNFFLNLIFQWSTGYRNAREAYQIAADQEYLRAELLRTQFIQDFQRTHPGQPMSNCQRAVMIQEKAGILPRIQPLY